MQQKIQKNGVEKIQENVLKRLQHIEEKITQYGALMFYAHEKKLHEDHTFYYKKMGDFNNEKTLFMENVGKFLGVETWSNPSQKNRLDKIMNICMTYKDNLATAELEIDKFLHQTGNPFVSDTVKILLDPSIDIL